MLQLSIVWDCLNSLSYPLSKSCCYAKPILVESVVQKQVNTKNLKKATFFYWNPMPVTLLYRKEGKLPYHGCWCFREENAKNSKATPSIKDVQIATVTGHQIWLTSLFMVALHQPKSKRSIREERKPRSPRYWSNS
jgi:hypothetical protein